MSVIIRLQNLAWAASSKDIRKFFMGLAIPDGGVHIVGGQYGDAFIAFSSDDDARRAMLLNGSKLIDQPVTLLLSSKSEMQQVILDARNQPSGTEQPENSQGMNPQAHDLHGRQANNQPAFTGSSRQFSMQGGFQKTLPSQAAFKTNIAQASRGFDTPMDPSRSNQTFSGPNPSEANYAGDFVVNDNVRGILDSISNSDVFNAFNQSDMSHSLQGVGRGSLTQKQFDANSYPGSIDQSNSGGSGYTEFRPDNVVGDFIGDGSMESGVQGGGFHPMSSHGPNAFRGRRGVGRPAVGRGGPVGAGPMGRGQDSLRGHGPISGTRLTSRGNGQMSARGGPRQAPNVGYGGGDSYERMDAGRGRGVNLPGSGGRGGLQNRGYRGAFHNDGLPARQEFAANQGNHSSSLGRGLPVNPNESGAEFDSSQYHQNEIANNFRASGPPRGRGRGSWSNIQVAQDRNLSSDNAMQGQSYRGGRDQLNFGPNFGRNQYGESMVGSFEDLSGSGDGLGGIDQDHRVKPMGRGQDPSYPMGREGPRGGGHSIGPREFGEKMRKTLLSTPAEVHGAFNMRNTRGPHNIDKPPRMDELGQIDPDEESSVHGYVGRSGFSRSQPRADGNVHIDSQTNADHYGAQFNDHDHRSDVERSIGQGDGFRRGFGNRITPAGRNNYQYNRGQYEAGSRPAMDSAMSTDHERRRPHDFKRQEGSFRPGNQGNPGGRSNSDDLNVTWSGGTGSPRVPLRQDVPRPSSNERQESRSLRDRHARTDEMRRRSPSRSDHQRSRHQRRSRSPLRSSSSQSSKSKESKPSEDSSKRCLHLTMLSEETTIRDIVKFFRDYKVIDQDIKLSLRNKEAVVKFGRERDALNATSSGKCYIAGSRIKMSIITRKEYDDLLSSRKSRLDDTGNDAGPSKKSKVDEKEKSDDKGKSDSKGRNGEINKTDSKDKNDETKEGEKKGSSKTYDKKDVIASEEEKALQKSKGKGDDAVTSKEGGTKDSAGINQKEKSSNILTCLRIFGLSFSTQPEQLKDFFKDIRFEMSKLYLLYTEPKKVHSVGFIEFENEKDCSEAVKLNNEYLGSRYLQLTSLTKREMLSGMTDNEKSMAEKLNLTDSDKKLKYISAMSSSNLSDSNKKPPSSSSRYDRNSRDRQSSNSGESQRDYRSSRDRSNQRNGPHSRRDESSSRYNDTRRDDPPTRYDRSPRDVSLSRYDRSRRDGPSSRFDGPQRDGPSSRFDGTQRDGPSSSFDEPQGDASQFADIPPWEEGPSMESFRGGYRGRRGGPSGHFEPPDGGIPSFPEGGPMFRGRGRGIMRGRGRGRGQFHGFGPGPMPVPTGPRVGMHNVAYSTSPMEIEEFFFGFNIAPGSVVIERDENGKPTGNCTVQFQRSEDAQQALIKLQGKPIRGRNISLNFA